MTTFQIGDIVYPSVFCDSIHLNVKHQSLGVVINIRQLGNLNVYGVFILYKNPFTFSEDSNFSKDLYPISRKYAFDLLLKYYNVHERTFDTQGIREAISNLNITVKYYRAESMLLASTVDEALAAMPVTENDDPPYVGTNHTTINTRAKRQITALAYQRNTLKSVKSLMQKMNQSRLQRIQGPRLSL